jgi:hypothetical protein
MKEISLFLIGFLAVCFISLVIIRHEINKAQHDYQAYQIHRKNLLEGIDDK